MKKEKEPGIAAALNIIPGLGYLYIGTRKTFANLLLVGLILGVISMFDPAYAELASGEEVNLYTTAAMLSFLAMLAAFVVDAYKEAKRHNTENTQKK